MTEEDIYSLFEAAYDSFDREGNTPKTEELIRKALYAASDAGFSAEEIEAIHAQLEVARVYTELANLDQDLRKYFFCPTSRAATRRSSTRSWCRSRPLSCHWSFRLRLARPARSFHAARGMYLAITGREAGRKLNSSASSPKKCPGIGECSFEFLIRTRMVAHA
jgi:hypothetical protein